MVFIFIFHKILNYKVFFSFLVLLWPRTSTYFLSRRTRVSFQDLHVWIIKIIHFPTIENPTVSTEQNPNLLIEETTFFFFFYFSVKCYQLISQELKCTNIQQQFDSKLDNEFAKSFLLNWQSFKCKT